MIKNVAKTGILTGLLSILLLCSIPVSAQLTDDQVEALVAEIKAGSELANKLLKNYRSDRLSTTVVLDQADFDEKDIIAWFEANVRWVPYRGVLKGVSGTLASRQGNSLDRSLLLAHLLVQAGYETRLARTTLTPDVAKSMVDRAFTRSVHAGIQLDLTDFGQGIVDRAEEQTEELSKVVGAPMPFNKEALYDVAADHWWVQTSREFAWVDIDPLFPDDQATHRPAPELILSSDQMPQALPAELFHRTTIRLVIERFDGGTLITEMPVQHTLIASDDLTQTLDIDFLPFDDDQPATGDDVNSSPAEIAANADAWMPVINLNGQRIIDQGFTSAGLLDSNPAKPTAHRKVDKANSALARISGQVESAEPDSILTGAWIEYVIERPQEKPLSIRRQLFNIMTAASSSGQVLIRPELTEADVLERGLALMMRSQILVTNGEPPLEAFDQGMLKLWGETGNLIAGVVRHSNDPTSEEPRERLSSGRIYPTDLLALATFREVLTPFHQVTFLPQVNIFSNHYIYQQDGSGPFHAMDIVLNDIEVFPHSNRFRAQMHQGVLDTILESSLFSNGEDRENTSLLFERRDESGPWVVAHSSSVAKLKLSQTTLTHIESALAAGFIVLAPSQLPANSSGAWWRIDPHSGATLGIGPGGWGADVPETVGVHMIPAQVRAAVAKQGSTAVCTGVAVGVTAVAVATNLPFHYTQPSIKALARPLLRTHCGVVGSWIPP